MTSSCRFTNSRICCLKGQKWKRYLLKLKGQVGYHHSLTWHGSPNNRSEMKRRAIAVHYMPGHTYYAPTGGHPMEPHIHVAPGEIMSGESFPAVYQEIALR